MFNARWKSPVSYEVCFLKIEAAFIGIEPIV